MDKMNLRANLLSILTEAKNTSGDSMQAIVEKAEGIKIESLANLYTHKNKYDEYDIEIIGLMIRILQEIYNNSGIKPPVPDELYDSLYEIYKDHSEEEIVGASVGARDKVISSHKYPDLRGTLDKIHFITNAQKPEGEKRKSLEDWKKSVSNRLGRPLGMKGESELFVTLFPKWDGLSVIFECDSLSEMEKALSRGDTEKNEAVEMTPLFKGTNFSYANPFYGDPSEIGVKTEVVMRRSNYEKLCEKYGDFKSPRSAVSSILNSKELDRKYLPYLTVIPLQVQNFNTKEIRIPINTEYPSIAVNINDTEDIIMNVEYLRKYVNDHYGIDIDGIVFRLIDPSVQALLGREDNINKYEVAYKFPPERTTTTLKKVEFSVGTLGAISPVAVIEPVRLKGNKITNISLGSIDRFESLDLREGDEVIIKYDVIPYLDIDGSCKKGNGMIFETPTHCPFCESELKEEPVLRCVNNECDSRKIGKIMNYVDKMRIPNISIGIITTLFNEKFLSDVSDLYALEAQRRDLEKLPGFGEKSISKIIDGINSRREVYDYELLGALGIPDIAERIFKKILNIYYLTELEEICMKGKVEKLKIIPGIQTKTAEKIIAGVRLNKDLIEFLCSKLKVSRDERKYTVKVLFTKVRDEEFEKYLERIDVMVMEDYNKEVDLVIVPTLTTDSSKVDKARKAKPPKTIIAIQDAYKMFGYTKS